MPPSDNAVLASVEQIIAKNPTLMYDEGHLSLLVMRELRSSSSYVVKVIDKLVTEGSLKQIRVNPAGYLHLTNEDRATGGLTLVYLQPRDYGDPVYGTLGLKKSDQGNLWKGNRPHPYITTPAAWAALKADLAAKAESIAKGRKAESEERRQREQALIGAAIPDYPKAMEVLAELLPGVEFKVMPFAMDRDDPRIHLDVEGLRMSDLKKVVELVLKNASTS